MGLGLELRVRARARVKGSVPSLLLREGGEADEAAAVRAVGEQRGAQGGVRTLGRLLLLGLGLGLRWG